MHQASPQGLCTSPSCSTLHPDPPTAPRLTSLGLCSDIAPSRHQSDASAEHPGPRRHLLTPVLTPLLRPRPLGAVSLTECLFPRNQKLGPLLYAQCLEQARSTKVVYLEWMNEQPTRGVSWGNRRLGGVGTPAPGHPAEWGSALGLSCPSCMASWPGHFFDAAWIPALSSPGPGWQLPPSLQAVPSGDSESRGPVSAQGTPPAMGSGLAQGSTVLAGTLWELGPGAGLTLNSNSKPIISSPPPEAGPEQPSRPTLIPPTSLPLSPPGDHPQHLPPPTQNKWVTVRHSTQVSDPVGRSHYVPLVLPWPQIIRLFWLMGPLLSQQVKGDRQKAVCWNLTVRWNGGTPETLITINSNNRNNQHFLSTSSMPCPVLSALPASFRRLHPTPWHRYC